MRDELSNFILFAGALFAILGVVNLMRPHKRWLGVSNLLAAAAAILFSRGADRAWIVGTIVVGLVCMAMDVATRTRRAKA